jgi:hypothetical protein
VRFGRRLGESLALSALDKRHAVSRMLCSRKNSIFNTQFDRSGTLAVRQYQKNGLAAQRSASASWFLTSDVPCQLNHADIADEPLEFV